MNGIAKNMVYQTIQTNHITYHCDINTCGLYSFFELPLLSSFGNRDFPISLRFPCRKEPSSQFLIENHLSFLWAIELLSDNSLLLKRSAMPDSTFVNGICKETGEILQYVSEGTEKYYIAEAESGEKFYFPLPQRNETRYPERIVFPDGFVLYLTKTNSSLVLASASMKAGGTEPDVRYIFSVQINQTDSIIEYYRSVNNEKEPLLYLELEGADDITLSATEYQSENITRKTSYLFEASRNPNRPCASFSYYQTRSLYDIPYEKISISEDIDYNYGLVINSYQCGNTGSRAKTLIYKINNNIFVKDITFPDSTNLEVYSIASTNVPDVFRVTSIFNSEGWAEACFYNTDGQIAEAGEQICYDSRAIKGDQLLSDGYFEENAYSSWHGIDKTRLGDDAQIETKTGIQYPFPSLAKDTGYLLSPGESIYQAVDNPCHSEESLTLAFFALSVDKGKTAELKVTLSSSKTIKETTINDKQLPFGTYVFLSSSITFTKAVHAEKCIIQNSGSSTIYLKAVGFYYDVASKKYEYDQNGLIKNVVSGGKTVKTKSDSLGRRLYTYGEQSSGKTTYHNTTHLPTSVSDGFGGKKEYSYKHIPETYLETPNARNYVCTSLSLTGSDGKQISKSAKYDPILWKRNYETDALGNVSITTYDYLGRAISRENEKTGFIKAVSYDAEGRPNQFRISSGNDSTTQTITYSNDLVSSVTNGKENVYYYNYDNNNRKSSISSKNGVVLESYEYNSAKNGKLSNFKIGSDRVAIQYDEQNQITRIQKIKQDGTILNDYHFSYYGTRLSSVEDSKTNIASLFSTNNTNSELRKTSLEVDGAVVASVYFDKDTFTGKRQLRLTDSYSKDLVMSTSPMQPVFRGDMRTLKEQMLNNGAYCAFFDYENDFQLYYNYEDTEEDFSELRSLSPRTSDATSTIDEPIPYANVKNLSYSINDTTTTLSLSLLFKQSSGEIFNIDFGGLKIIGSIISSNFTLNIKQNDYVIKSITMPFKPLNGKWNSFGFSIVNSTSLFAFLNDDLESLEYLNLPLSEKTEITLSFGTRLTRNQYAGIALQTKESMSREKMMAMKRVYSSLLTPISLKSDNNKTFFQEKHTNWYDNGAYVIPLDASLLTTRGKMPSVFQALRQNMTLKSRQMFQYNEELGRNMYIADGATLIYDINFNKAGTVGLKFYPFSYSNNNSKRYVCALASNSSGTQFISIYIQNNLLYISIGSQSHIISGSLDENGLNEFAFTYAVTTTSSGTTYTDPDQPETNDVMIKTYLNGTIGSVLFSKAEYHRPWILSVGHPATSSDGDINDSLQGLVADIYLSANQSSDQSLQNIFQNGNIRTYQETYDSLQRLQSCVIRNCHNGNILSRDLQYAANGTKTSKLIAEETLKLKSGWTKTIPYEFDTDGRLEKYGERTLQYDYRGYLVSDSENGESLSYDENGNILTRINNEKTREYHYRHDSVSNQLQRVDSSNGDSIVFSYSSSRPGYPTSKTRTESGKATSFQFQYAGRSLSTLSVDGRQWRYDYDYSGRRVRKTDPDGEETLYLYSGNVLSGIYQPSTGRSAKLVYATDYLPLSIVVSQSLNASPVVYHYIFDSFGLLIGLADDEGNMVVEYEYDLFGKPLACRDTSGIGLGSLNPFRFKGYVYDEESGLYYLTTRYYDPEIGRFLTPDNLEQLDPEKAAGLNLYVYCNNDPVLFFDPEGEMGMAQGTALLILGIVAALTMALMIPLQIPVMVGGAILGSCFSGMATLAFMDDLTLDTADDLIISMLFGAVGGILGASGLGVIATAASNFGLAFLESSVTMVANGSRDIGEILTSSLVSGVASLVISEVISLKMNGKLAVGLKNEWKKFNKKMMEGLNSMQKKLTSGLLADMAFPEDEMRQQLVNDKSGFVSSFLKSFFDKVMEEAKKA